MWPFRKWKLIGSVSVAYSTTHRDKSGNVTWTKENMNMIISMFTSSNRRKIVVTSGKEYQSLIASGIEDVQQVEYWLCGGPLPDAFVPFRVAVPLKLVKEGSN